MSRVNLKDNIWIEGFDKEWQYRQRLYGNKGIFNAISLIYQGKTSDIPEELAKEYVIKNKFYLNYQLQNINDWREKYMFITAKESINSVCQEEYCIIYEIK